MKSISKFIKETKVRTFMQKQFKFQMFELITKNGTMIEVGEKQQKVEEGEKNNMGRSHWRVVIIIKFIVRIKKNKCI